MSQDIVALARRHKHIASHYEGCEADHVGCLVHRLADEVEGLRAERDALRGAAREYLQTLGGAMKSGKFEIRPAVYVLLSDDREDHDGLSDEICGCYLSREAAERAGNELNVRWRIEEYGLEGKP